MKTLFAVLICVLAGLVGLAFVFRDLPIDPGPALIGLAGVFYIIVGFALTKLDGGRRPLLWGTVPGWGLAILGFAGVWTTIADPPSGDWTLALLFLLGPGVAGVLGASLAKAKPEA